VLFFLDLAFSEQAIWECRDCIDVKDAESFIQSQLLVEHKGRAALEDAVKSLLSPPLPPSAAEAVPPALKKSKTT
jgi:hypothetical protein